MRNFSFQNIKGKLGMANVLPEVEDEVTLKNFLGYRNVSSQELEAIRQGIADLAGEPEKFRVKPKFHLEAFTKQRYVRPVAWPLYVATSGLMQDFMPLGLSIGLISDDGYAISLQRALTNRSCKGFLGTPAGYMVLPYIDFAERKMPETVNLDEMIANNVRDQLGHELGLKPEEYTYTVEGIIQVDYPEKQDELLVSAVSSLSAQEIIDRAAENKGTDTGLAETQVIALTEADLEFLMKKQVPVASQHLAALCYAAGMDIGGIAFMDRPNPAIPFEEKILDILSRN